MMRRAILVFRTSALGLAIGPHVASAQTTRTDRFELPLEAPLRRSIREAFRAAGGEAPERLWHDLIFYTAGEVTRIVLEEQGLDGYVHYE